MVEDRDVVIVGAGPAGLSTGLHLARFAPDIASRTLILEKEEHPRVKLCGGGVTWPADALLAGVGLHVDVPSVPIHAMRFRYQNLDVVYPERHIFRVVRRDRFDRRLAEAAQRRGLEIRQGEPVVDLERVDGRVALTTSRGAYRAKVVVGADGAKGVVRRWMDLPERPRVSRLLEILTPEDSGSTPEFVKNEAVFDFSPTADDVQGYVWDFPSLVEGRPYMNRGIFDSRVHPDFPRAQLKDELRRALGERGVELGNWQLKGHPERWFDPAATYAKPHAILAGDAAGVEPLLGEGISFAIGYGYAASAALQKAFATDDFSFSDYTEVLLSNWVGGTLRRRTALAKIAYRLSFPRLLRPLFHLAAWVLR